ncbi:hypothetical protein [Streptacidiphilus rugosus]|uniref:hypothetical protein n=1 Tax=Streptacidiphilus rugosus TaxID=405783 RepID=UPI00055E7C6A|nr:hypothetical protein [Streptacidiphilus rugosus]
MRFQVKRVHNPRGEVRVEQEGGDESVLLLDERVFTESEAYFLQRRLDDDPSLLDLLIAVAAS